jgi:CHAT domain-containing protein
LGVGVLHLKRYWPVAAVTLALSLFVSPSAAQSNEAEKLNQTLIELYRAGNYAEAVPLAQRWLATWEKALGPDHPDIANVLNNLAELYRAQGRYADAEPLYKRSLAISEKALGPTHPDVAVSLNNLAGLYERQDRLVDALPLIRAAAQKGFNRKKVYLDVLMGGAANSTIPNADALNESYQVVQQAASSAASSAINQLSVRFAAENNQLAQFVRRDQDLSAEYESLDRSLIAAVTKEPSKRDSVIEQQIRDRLQEITVERAHIEAELTERFPRFADLAKPSPLSIGATQSLLADDEAFVLLDFDQRSYAWIITQSSAEWLELKTTAKDIQAQVTSLRLSLTGHESASFDVGASYRLYQSVFSGFAEKIASKKRLSVVTNSALTSIPLQLLVTKEPGGKKLKDVDWLVRSYAITVLPSVASLKTLREVSGLAAAPKPMIAFADPVFSKTAKREAWQQVAMRGMTSFVTGSKVDIPSLAEQLPQLPSTRNEVQAIAEVLRIDPSDIRLGLDATVTAVKTVKLDQYRIVYFATHGLVTGDLEQFAKGKVEPSLALSIPDKPTDFEDGLLSASEVAQLKLNAEWVVLSACNTAAEEKAGAEAFSGLARAFFYAGARSLIVSHWQVDDQATAKLMTKIFLLMRENPRLSHGEALQQAMLASIDSATSEDELHPRLWGPFVVVGEPPKPPSY